MIALRNNLPLVCFPDGQVFPFERNWLAGSLTRAAEQAGYKKWWLAPHVLESVTTYFEQDFSENTVTIQGLEKAVQSVLQVIGYADVAGCFRATPPPARISLEELARDAGHDLSLDQKTVDLIVNVETKQGNITLESMLPAEQTRCLGSFDHPEADATIFVFAKCKVVE